ncbi:unnamed protein product [Calypogeia fissa]
MEVVTIDNLLKSAIPCSSSAAFLSESSFSQNVISTEENHPVLASKVNQTVLGKRTREKQKAQRTGAANCQMMKVLPQCQVIVGRLQLCNRDVHYWNGLFVPADCVALSDSTATICCCFCQGPDPSFLGKIVIVKSWNFIPQAKNPLTRVQSSGPLSSYCRLGILEIHSFELVEGLPSEETIIPSLFVSPATGNGQKDPKQETQGRGLSLRGTLQCISPPFILPCKLSRDNGKLPSEAGSSRMEEKEECNSVQFPGDRMLGFFVGIQFCSACSPTFSYIWKISVQRELYKPRKVDATGRSTDFSEQSLGVGSKTKHSKTTTQQGPISKNSSSSCTPHETAGTFCSKTYFEGAAGLSHVYFSGSVAAWRPVLSGAMGRCVTITGLKKKLILVGSDKKPHVMFLATQKSVITLDCGRQVLGRRLKISPLHGAEDKNLHSTFGVKELEMGSDPPKTKNRNFRVERSGSPAKISKLLSDFVNTFDAFERDKDFWAGCSHGDQTSVEEGNGRSVNQGNRLVSFVGIVTDSLFQGTLLELDGRVWLLLTHQRHTKLHGLRIGAMLSLRNVHTITIRDLMGKSLLFGACMHSHISVVLFSPVLTQGSLQIQSKSLLFKHIQRLSFTSTFWLLSLIGSFRQKFRDIYSTKELLGGKKDLGLIQKYVQKMIAPVETPERDVVKEVFQKRYCKLGNKYSTPIMQVPPILNFCEHVRALWQNYRSLDSMSERSKTGTFILRRKSSTSGHLRQLTIASHVLGMTLLGSLQVCQTSGRLVLLDATGTVDVVIPDLLSSEHLSKTYQVSRFTVKLEGLEQASPANDEIVAKLISWSSLLKTVEAVRSSEFLRCRVHFFIRDATYIHDLDWQENVTPQTDLLYHSKDKGWWQKQGRDRWTKMKSHLDFLKLWFQSQTAEVAGVHCSNYGLGILSEHVGELVPSGHHFNVNCKVVAVRLLVFEWPCGRAGLEVRTVAFPSRREAKCSPTSWKSSFGIPLTLACFVVDDGSGPVDCWAQGDAAVSLLRLGNITGPLLLPDTILKRLCTNLGLVSEMQPFMELSLEQILSCMTQRYGQIVLQSTDPVGDSTGARYQMNSKTGNSLTADERSLMQLVVTSGCLNGPLAILGSNIPSMEKICSADRKKDTDACEVLACCSPRSQEATRAALLAHRVDAVNYLLDLQSLTEQVPGLL